MLLLKTERSNGDFMDYYLKIELFREGVSAGKGVTVYEAESLSDALKKACKMIDDHPHSLRSETPSIHSEERITVGPAI